MGFIATIIVGVLAGWLAEKVMKVDMPTWQNLLLGLCGSALGSIVLGVVSVQHPINRHDSIKRVILLVR